MCGYFGNLHQSPAVIDLLNQLGVPLPIPLGQYHLRRGNDALLRMNAEQKPEFGQSIWWYQLHWDKDKERFQVNPKITSFNARDLTKPMWRNAIKERRGLVVATEIGESKGKKKYLMRADEGLLLGAVYKDWVDQDGNVTTSMAIITRPPHPRFSKFHDKSIPCFLPHNKAILQDWLNPNIDSNSQLERLLNEPHIYQNLSVTEVKTYKNADHQNDAELLTADE